MTNFDITPCLWFDNQAEEAARFYVSIFKNSKIGTITRYSEAGHEIHGKPAGSVLTIAFELDGQPFIGAQRRAGLPVQRGNLVSDPLPDANRRGLLLGKARRRRRPEGPAMRLAQRQVRRLLAGGP